MITGYMSSAKLYGHLNFVNDRELGGVLEIGNVENDYIICADDLTVYLQVGYALPDGTIIFSANEFENYSENSFVK